MSWKNGRCPGLQPGDKHPIVPIVQSQRKRRRGRESPTSDSAQHEHPEYSHCREEDAQQYEVLGEQKGQSGAKGPNIEQARAHEWVLVVAFPVFLPLDEGPQQKEATTEGEWKEGEAQRLDR